MKYIHRDLEPLLKKLVKQFPAAVVTGPRQSGKSTLLKKIFGKEYSYVSFDDPVTRERALSDPKLFLANAGEKVIIDEIQYVPQLLSYVKMSIDEHRQKRGQFLFTGSQQFPLIKALGDSLAGRIGIVELLPFSLEEKKRTFKSQRKFSTTREYFSHACLRGSYPELVVKKDIDTYFWYSSYLQTYLERDVRTLYNIGNLRDFQRCLHLLAARLGQTLHLSSLASDLGVAVNTVKHWISVLEASRMIYLLSPYYSNVGKRIVKSPKLYFLDCGLVCYLLSIKDRDSLFYGPLAGALFENFCIQETVKSLAHQGRKEGIYYLRTHTGLEIDMLIERQGVLYPIEWKLSATPTLHMVKPMEQVKNLFSKLPIRSGFVVSLSDKKFPLTREVIALGVDDYLSWLRGD